MLAVIPRDQWSWNAGIARDATELQVLAVDYDEKTVLLYWEDDKWVMPGRFVDSDVLPSCVEPFRIIPIFHDIVGTALPMEFLRCFWSEKKEGEYKGVHSTFEKSVVLLGTVGDRKDCANGYQWVSLDNTDIYHLFEEAQHAIRTELAWIAKGHEPSNRLTWERRGWYERASSWMKEQLKLHCEAEFQGSTIHLRSFQIGAIIQANTDHGRFFLKCNSLRNDAAYTEVLSRVVPKYVAKPVVVDKKQGMMITADYVEILEPFFQFSKLEFEDMAGDYARLQKEAIWKVDELLEGGVPDFRPPKLLMLIDELIGCSVFLQLGDTERSVQDVRYVVGNSDVCKKVIQILIDSNMPATISHNDIFTSNVYRQVGCKQFMFFDWCDGAVVHPFCTSEPFLKHNTYFEEWREFGTLEQLKAWYYVGGVVYPLIEVMRGIDEIIALEAPYDREGKKFAKEHLNSFVRSMRAFSLERIMVLLENGWDF